MSFAADTMDGLRLAVGSQPVIAACVESLRHRIAAIRDADDVVALMQAAADLIVAIEDLEAGATGARKAARMALAETMAEIGATKIETEHHTVSVRDAPQMTVIADADTVPADYWRQPEPQIDKMLVRKALLDGFPVPGAALSNGGAPTLTIRSKAQ